MRVADRNYVFPSEDQFFGIVLNPCVSFTFLVRSAFHGFCCRSVLLILYELFHVYSMYSLLLIPAYGSVLTSVAVLMVHILGTKKIPNLVSETIYLGKLENSWRRTVQCPLQFSTQMSLSHI